MSAARDEAAGFPPFPPGRRTRKGLSWWTLAWIDAMEHAALEPNRLARGRTYANTGRVGPIAVAPGLVSAPVQGTRASPYRTRLHLQTLTDGPWDAFLDAAASSAARLAALLDGEMPHDLVTAAADAGVPLLPGPGDLDPECSCPDWGHPCKHAAALSYQAGWLLDAEPFVLLLMRGRGESRLRSELAARNAAHAGAAHAGAAPAVGPGTGVPAREAFRARVGELPADPDLPREPVRLALPPAAGVDVELLAAAAGDAAAVARDLLSGRALDDRAALVRFAAGLPPGLRRRLAARHPAADLPRAIAAWEWGGPGALQVLDQPWTPPGADLARARIAVEQAWAGDELPAITRWRNRWTLTTGTSRLQLRYGRDARWYPYRDMAGTWWPAGFPDADPVTVLIALLTDPPAADPPPAGPPGTPSAEHPL